jgi:tetratricopeptide (TPR) repeat protein
MDTVFRIDDIQQLDSKSPIYQVNLKLTSDDDQQLRELTEFIREDDASKIGWSRLGNLLLKIGQFDKVAEFYTALLEQTSDNSTRAGIYRNLGVVKQFQGDYKETPSFLEKSLKIKQKPLPENHPSFATTYNSIDEVCRSMGND